MVPGPMLQGVNPFGRRVGEPIWSRWRRLRGEPVLSHADVEGAGMPSPRRRSGTGRALFVVQIRHGTG